MSVLIDLLPLASVLALLASGRVSMRTAGLVGLALTLALIPAVLPPGVPRLQFLLAQGLKGGWIAWLAISIILAGLFFYQAVRLTHASLFTAGQGEANGDARAPNSTFSYRWLFAIAFFLGPFAESATGFGVGLIIALSFLARMGFTGAAAVAFGLFSQILVPWGALAVGTLIGASLAHVPVAAVGLRCALLTVPLLLADLGIFWWLARRAGYIPGGRQRLMDVLWVLLLGSLLWLANRLLSTEIAGVAASGLALALFYLANTRPRLADLRRVWPLAAPYIILTLALVTTRTVAPLRNGLQQLAVWQPYPGLPAFALLFHPSTWLVLVACATLLRGGPKQRLQAALAATGQAARTPVAVTLLFVLMGHLMAASGMADALARAGAHLAGAASWTLAPLLGAMAGFLTGSNVASNSMMMPLLSALAGPTHADPLWLAAIQTTIGSSFTLLSPIRVAMGCALAGLSGREHAVYRQILPFGLAALGLMLAASFLVL